MRRLGQTTFAGNALRHIESLELEAVYLFRDLGPHLDDAVVQRVLKEVAAKFRGQRSTVIITGGSIGVPKEVGHDVVYLAMELPNRDELAAVVSATVQGLRFGAAGTVAMDEAQGESLLHALSGMTVNQARQAVARAVLEDGRLDAADTARIYEGKAEVLRDGGLLEFYAAKDNQFELGGIRGIEGLVGPGGDGIYSGGGGDESDATARDSVGGCAGVREVVGGEGGGAAMGGAVVEIGCGASLRQVYGGDRQEFPAGDGDGGGDGAGGIVDR
jgi:hypothetical protein